jgi:hypothetical protein
MRGRVPEVGEGVEGGCSDPPLLEVIETLYRGVPRGLEFATVPTCLYARGRSPRVLGQVERNIKNASAAD